MLKPTHRELVNAEYWVRVHLMPTAKPTDPYPNLETIALYLREVFNPTKETDAKDL